MQSFETREESSHRKMHDASVYSARIQEAMRYDKLSSANYSLAMTLMNAVLQGYSEERWKTERESMIKALTLKSPDKNVAHADAANLYEQMVGCMKDLDLWPWQ
ncbi:hypothetical protein KDA_56590 [Dictyobacter alpinus]|uniref:Uncharacterized protein n=1 Tax=Dictyobacter alpinus TaxID=2014873 RepID=A0A402BFK9_9CHLR|nr:hypothetical protein [Dictyobacter alpinus]GCE30175.1 hypothetical protein KDA_56590 [Dictyobacter alpinus]